MKCTDADCAEGRSPRRPGESGSGQQHAHQGARSDVLGSAGAHGPEADRDLERTVPCRQGRQIGDLRISLQAEGAGQEKAPQAATRSDALRRPGLPASRQDRGAPSKPPVAPSQGAAADEISAPRRVSRRPKRGLPDLDSTQTIRALTSDELNDDSQEKWFAIQLAASEQPVNLDAMPHLDIFEAYRLYSVATAGSGKIVHSLRLGFFKEAVSAEAVSRLSEDILRFADGTAHQRRRAGALQGRAGREEARCRRRVASAGQSRRTERRPRRAACGSHRHDGSSCAAYRRDRCVPHE